MNIFTFYFCFSKNNSRFEIGWFWIALAIVLTLI